MGAIPPGTDLSTIPLSANPNGDPPNFLNPPSQGNTVIGVGVPMIFISTICVVIRLSTALKITRKMSLDDCKWHS